MPGHPVPPILFYVADAWWKFGELGDGPKPYTIKLTVGHVDTLTVVIDRPTSLLKSQTNTAPPHSPPKTDQ